MSHCYGYFFSELVGVCRRVLLSGWDEDVIAEVAVADGETVTCAVSRSRTPTDRLLLLQAPHHDTEHTPHTLTSYTIYNRTHPQQLDTHDFPYLLQNWASCWKKFALHSEWEGFIQQVDKGCVLVLESRTDSQFTQYTVLIHSGSYSETVTYIQMLRQYLREEICA